MARVEIYQEAPPREMSGLQTFLLSLAQIATVILQRIDTLRALAPGPVILLIVFIFLVLCNEPPTFPAAAALVASLLWWFLVMTEGRLTLRIIIAAALIAEIYRLLELTWFLPSPLKI